MHAVAAPETERERALHIRLDPKLHRRVRIAAAEDDVSLQEWMRRALTVALEARYAGQRRP